MRSNEEEIMQKREREARREEERKGGAASAPVRRAALFTNTTTPPPRSLSITRSFIHTFSPLPLHLRKYFILILKITLSYSISVIKRRENEED